MNAHFKLGEKIEPQKLFFLQMLCLIEKVNFAFQSQADLNDFHDN